MNDIEQHLRRLVEDGAARARRPPVQQLRDRLRQRRRRVGTASIAAAMIALVIPVAAGYLSGNGGNSPTPATRMSTDPQTTEISTNPPSEPMSASPTTTTAGGTIHVTGMDCGATTVVTFSVGNDRAHTTFTRAGADGGFTAPIKIPAVTPAGPLTLWAACLAPNPAGKLLHTATVEITP